MTKKISFLILSFLFALFLPLNIIKTTFSADLPEISPAGFCKFTPEGSAAGTPTGNVILNNDCVVYENLSGVADGDLTVNSTITLHHDLVFYPNHKITVQPGAIIYVNSGSKIQQGKICIKDADNDDYPDPVTITTDPLTGQNVTTSVLKQIDSKVVLNAPYSCETNYKPREGFASLAYVDTNVDVPLDFATADNIFLQMGFEINGVTDANAAAGDIIVPGSKNLILNAPVPPETGGKLGIGLTNPAEKLQIAAGNVLLDNNQSIQFKDSNGTARNVLNYSSADNITIAGLSGTSDVYLNSASTFALKSAGNVIVGSATSGGSKLAVAGNMSIGSTYKGTNAPTDGLIIQGQVGIGLTNPTYDFHVNGDTYFNYSTTSDTTEYANRFYSQNTGSSSNIAIYGRARATNYNGTTGGTYGLWYTASSYNSSANNMTVQSSRGAYLLNEHVLTSTGNLTVQNAYALLASSPAITKTGAGTLSVTAQHGIYVSNQGNAYTTTAYGIRVLDQTAATNNYSIVTNAGNAVFNEGGDANTDFRVEGDTNANLLFVDASADNIGIGTTTPGSPLTIISGTGSGLSIDTTSGTGRYSLYGGPTTTHSQLQSYYVGPPGANIGKPLSLNPLGGNVGVGKTDPATAFEIYSAIQYDGLRVSNGTNRIAELVGMSATNNDGNLTLYSGGVSKVSVNANGSSSFIGGNVGVGITNPANTLDVAGSLTVTGALSSGKGIALSDEGTYKRIQSYDSEPLSINPIANNVGIGITNPEQKLDVVGNIAVSGSSGNSIYTWSRSDANWRIGMSDSPGFTRSMATSHVQYGTYGSGAGQGFAVGVIGGNSSFEITGSNHVAYFRGNVGINVTNAPQPLTVVGPIQVGNGYISAGWSAGEPDTRFITAGSTYYDTGTSTYRTNPNANLGSNAITTISLDASSGIRFMTQPSTGNTARSESKATFNGYTRMTIDVDGRVGIGRTPTTNALEVNGDASKNASGSWLANSDRRIKTNIQDISNAVATLQSLRPVSFKYSNQYRSSAKGVGDFTYYNFIAQEFQQVFPNSVQDSGQTIGNDSHILQVDTYPVIPYLVKGIQEQQKEITDLKAQLDTQQQQIDELKKAIQELKNK